MSSALLKISPIPCKVYDGDKISIFSGIEPFTSDQPWSDITSTDAVASLCVFLRRFISPECGNKIVAKATKVISALFTLKGKKIPNGFVDAHELTSIIFQVLLNWEVIAKRASFISDTCELDHVKLDFLFTWFYRTIQSTTVAASRVQAKYPKLKTLLTSCLDLSKIYQDDEKMFPEDTFDTFLGYKSTMCNILQLLEQNDSVMIVDIAAECLPLLIKSVDNKSVMCSVRNSMIDDDTMTVRMTRVEYFPMVFYLLKDWAVNHQDEIESLHLVEFINTLSISTHGANMKRMSPPKFDLNTEPDSKKPRTN